MRGASSAGKALGNKKRRADPRGIAHGIVNRGKAGEAVALLGKNKLGRFGIVVKIMDADHGIVDADERPGNASSFSSSFPK